MTLRSVVVSGLMIVGCSGSSGSEDGAARERALQQVVAQQVELDKRLSAVPAADREKCETRAGECLMLGAERRDSLILQEQLSECRAAPDRERELQCMARELRERGKLRELTDHQTFENWCTDKLLACAAVVAEENVVAARKARFDNRKRDAETSSQGLAVWNDVEAAKAKLSYMRSTLPPKLANACQAMDGAAACAERAKQEMAAFEAELRKEGDYDAKRATALYAASKATEASCPEPEFQCLVSALQAYGALPETRKWVDRNVQALRERQEVATHVPPDVQGECLTDTAAKHEARIVSAYQIYVKQPVLFFRTQLEKAFLTLHEDQVACLRGKGKVADLD